MEIENKWLCKAVLLLVIFAVLGLLVNTFQYSSLDLGVSAFFLVIQIPLLIFVASGISLLFEAIPVIIFSLIIAGILFFKKEKKQSIIFLAILFLTTVSFYAVKELLGRARPAVQAITETGYAFPSGHTTLAVVFFGLIIFIVWNRQNISIKRKKDVYAVGVSLIILILISRLYLNVHWLTDILGGIILGCFWLCIAFLIFKKVNKTAIGSAP